MRAVVVGGSLGGLYAALLLRDLGVDVDIFERSPVELAQRGAGIGFLPESQRYLVERAGVALDEISVPTAHIRYLHRNAELLFEAQHAYRFSSWNTVYRRLLTQFPAEKYHLAYEMTGWQSRQNRVEVAFAAQAPERANLVVMADGVGSLARALVARSANRLRRLCRLARHGAGSAVGCRCARCLR